jgi:hypothetical protein
MNADPDLMKAVAAADPLPDAERLPPAASHEAERLLARLLATPPEGQIPEAHAPQRRWQRWSLVAAGVACCAAVVFAAINLVDSDTPGPGVIEKAIAAVTQEESVYHVVQRKRGTGNVPGAHGGPFYVESWNSSDGRMHEKVFAAKGRRRGRLLEEVAGRRLPGRTGGPLLRYDGRQKVIYPSGFGAVPGADKLPTIDPNGDPAASLRGLQARGLLHVDGTTRIRDRRAYRLVSDPIGLFKGDGERYEYTVDSETYLPLTQRWSLHRGSERLSFVAEFLVYERLALDARSRALLDLDSHAGADCALGAGELGRRRLGFANPCPPSGREGPAP